MAIKIKEKLPYIFVILFLILSVGGFIYLNIVQNNNAKKANKFDPNISYNTIIISACEIYTLQDAQKLLNKNVQIEDSTVGAESNSDLDVSACSYTIPFKSAEELAKAKTSSVLIRSPKTIKGANINKQTFSSNIPTSGEDVKGYGQQAYWNPERAQLNVYKDGNWLIFSAGSLNVNQRTLEETKKLADLIMPKI